MLKAQPIILGNELEAKKKLVSETIICQASVLDIIRITWGQVRLQNGTIARKLAEAVQKHGQFISHLAISHEHETFPNISSFVPSDQL